ncbi:MAG: hypothetical protein HUJ68_03975 [Clostridia bacterium]|nr:hypothetical protein [Clostridia bacterium]
MLKKILIHTRRGIKLITFLIISAFLIVGMVALLYKPTYSVWLNNEQIGYTENKTKLQHTINEYIEKGDEENSNMAFIQIDEMPEYSLCLLKKGIVTNDDEIISKIKEGGVPYYRYYAVTQNDEEKLYVSNFEEAEGIINTLKEKNSTNIEEITIKEKYETKLEEFTNKDDAVAKLYVEPVVVAKTTNKVKTTGSVNTSMQTSRR